MIWNSVAQRHLLCPENRNIACQQLCHAVFLALDEKKRLKWIKISYMKLKTWGFESKENISLTPFFSWKAKNQTNMKAWVLELWMAWVFIFIWNARSTVMKYIYLSWLCFYTCSPLALFPLQKWPTNHVLSEGKWDI